MEGEKHTRFADTAASESSPPAARKGCMKGSRRINFADSPSEDKSTTDFGPATSEVPTPAVPATRFSATPGTASPKSPRKSAKFSSAEPIKITAFSEKAPQFQFNLTQHYEQATPPPNCTAYYNYDEMMAALNKAAAERGEKELDAELMEIASKFVNEIIENAYIEASIRQPGVVLVGAEGGDGNISANSSGAEAGSRGSIPNAFAQLPAAATNIRAAAEGIIQNTRQSYRRAQGTVSKWITNLCAKAQTMRT